MKKVQNIINFLLAVFVTVVAAPLLDIQSGWVIAGIFLISYPWKIGENIYSLFGGINSGGSIYSLCPLFQNAEKDAFGLICVTPVQRAKGSAICSLGLVGFQSSEKSSVFLGLAIFQFADKTANIFFGFCGVQSSEEKSVCVWGIVLFQIAKKESVLMVGFSLYQCGEGECVFGIGILLWQGGRGDNGIQTGENWFWIGIVLFQFAEKSSYAGFGIPLFQKAKNFGLNFSLVKDRLDSIKLA